MNKNCPTIVISGGNGLVGSELVNHFSAKGWMVRALVRCPERFKDSHNVRYYAYDMERILADTILQGADYLVHAAYVPNDKRHPDAFQINVDASKDILEASQKHNIKRRVFLSSMSARRDAVAIYGKQKYAVEQLFDHPQDTIIRSGLVIGNGGLVRKLVHSMKLMHIVPMIDGGNQPLQIIGVHDLAKVIEVILVKDINGKLLIGSTSVSTYREFYEALHRRFRLKAVFIPVPFFVPLYMIRLINACKLPFPVTEDNLWGLKQLKALNTQKDLEKIGVQLENLETVLSQVKIT